MEELHSSFNKRNADGSEQVQLKMALSLKDKLIKKISENSRFAVQTGDQDKMKTVEENNQLIASLDSLPVLFEELTIEKGKVLLLVGELSFRLSCSPGAERVYSPSEQTGQDPP